MKQTLILLLTVTPFFSCQKSEQSSDLNLQVKPINRVAPILGLPATGTGTKEDPYVITPYAGDGSNSAPFEFHVVQDSSFYRLNYSDPFGFSSEGSDKYIKDLKNIKYFNPSSQIFFLDYSYAFFSLPHRNQVVYVAKVEPVHFVLLPAEASYTHTIVPTNDQSLVEGCPETINIEPPTTDEELTCQRFYEQRQGWRDDSSCRSLQVESWKAVVGADAAWFKFLRPCKQRAY